MIKIDNRYLIALVGAIGIYAVYKIRENDKEREYKQAIARYDRLGSFTKEEESKLTAVSNVMVAELNAYSAIQVSKHNKYKEYIKLADSFLDGGVKLIAPFSKELLTSKAKTIAKEMKK